MVVIVSLFPPPDFQPAGLNPAKLSLLVFCQFAMTTRFAQILSGPAGSGKSTYIRRVADHYAAIKRPIHCVNLDPAVHYLAYDPDVDIRDAICVQDVMKRYKFGPNGALLCCLELISRDCSQWFSEAIGDHDYDYLLIDLPGQIELYSHLNVLPELFAILTTKGYNLLVVYCLDCQFMSDPAKFLSGSLVALSTMTMLQMPHINLLTKSDLLNDDDRRKIDWFTEMETPALAEEAGTGGLAKLTSKICEVIEAYNLVQWHLFSIHDDEIVTQLLSEIDMILQYYESVDYATEEFPDDEDEPEPDFPPGFKP
jgi:GTPase SAR1 family protein